MADNNELIKALLAGVKPPAQEPNQPGGFADYLRSWGSASLAQQQPNWFGQNVLANMPPEASLALGFVTRRPPVTPTTGFHGSPGELIGDVKTPFWMARSENQASHYMPLEKTPAGDWARTGTMNEFSVDPSGYLRVKEGGMLDRFAEADRRQTLFNWARRAGYKGVVFDADNEIVALDPATVQRAPKE